MVLYEQLNFEDERSRLNLERLSILQRKLLIDLIRQKRPQFWSRFRCNAYGWNNAKKQLNQFITEMNKTSFNHYGFSETVKRGDRAYV